MSECSTSEVNGVVFLTAIGAGRRVIRLKQKQSFFSQGDPADSVFFLQSGRAKLSVLSRSGKEAIVAMLSPRDFIGEESIMAVPGQRLATAQALTACTAIRIERHEVLEELKRRSQFSELFLLRLLAKNMRAQADLVDQLFNSSEKRLARLLLLMSQTNLDGEMQTSAPKISHRTLAEMVGTTRSRVSFFMRKFRKLGLIEYDGAIHVNESLLNLILQDQ